jgi:hypothetical protein
VRFFRIAAFSSTGRRRSGKPGITSGTRVTRSGGFSHASRSSLSRAAAAAMAFARGSSAVRQRARTRRV